MIDPTQEPARPQWLTFEAPDGDYHVVPGYSNDVIAGGHTLVRTCWCLPRLTAQNGTVCSWSHREPSWPGALPELLH